MSLCGPLQAEDLEDFTKRQKDHPEEWENLKDEICAIATGTGVSRIEGDQVVVPCSASVRVHLPVAVS